MNSHKNVQGQFRKRNVEGQPITHDIRSMRKRKFNSDSKECLKATKQIAKDIMKVINKDIWNTIRGKPTNFRKASIYMYGPPGTGKTLLQSILSRGMSKGFINTQTDNFSLADCHQVEVIIWEEATIPFQMIETYKKVMEGQGYPINIKGENPVFQNEWTPVIITSNKKFLSEQLTKEEEESLKERVIEIPLMEKWFSLDNKDLNIVDYDHLVNSLDLKWIDPK